MGATMEAISQIRDAMGQSSTPQLQNVAKPVREAIDKGKQH